MPIFIKKCQNQIVQKINVLQVQIKAPQHLQVLLW